MGNMMRSLFIIGDKDIKNRNKESGFRLFKLMRFQLIIFLVGRFRVKPGMTGGFQSAFNDK